jgi:hypothetical protein
MLLEKLQGISGLSPGQLERLAATASQRYKVYNIPKRTGGYRTIEQPSREIKLIQRWLNSALIKRLPVHECATAYSQGASILANAMRHVNSLFTLRADFVSFFPSFSTNHVQLFLTDQRKNSDLRLTDADINFVSRIVCRQGALTIGAPSSPLITNAMMFDFDAALHAWCKPRNLICTRYADDLFISSFEPNALADAVQQITEISSTYRYANLRLNQEKTAFLSRRYRRSITGLIVTPEQQISIGRRRKEHIKAKIYQYQKGRLSHDDYANIRGMIAFIRGVEPSFYDTLLRKYGAEPDLGLQARMDAQPNLFPTPPG